MTISLIYARSQNKVIGGHQGLPWNLPEDLKHFQRTTMGGFVVMGRKTWEALPEKSRPLKGRVNIVLSRDADFTAQGAIVFHSLYQVLSLHDSQPSGTKFWVIGGEQIFKQFASQADQVIETVILEDYEGDTHFDFKDTIPSEFPEEFSKEQTPIMLSESSQLRYYIETLNRNIPKRS